MGGISTELSQEISKAFAKAVTKEPDTKQSSFVYGTAKKMGSNIYVKIDGSDIYTPVSSMVDVD